jgi:hypothetical protein
MQSKIPRSIYLAHIISGITNPTILAVLALLLIIWTEANGFPEFIKWFAVIMVFFVCIPAVYVYIKTSHAENRFKSLVGLTKYLKQHPAQILVLALVLGLSCIVVLSVIKASPALIATVTALLAGSVITSLFYLFYRVSFHLTGLVIIIIMVAQVWGQPYLFLLFTVPPVFWAKYHLRDHTIPQLFAGIAVATIVSLLTLLLFGRLNTL